MAKLCGLEDYASNPEKKLVLDSILAKCEKDRNWDERIVFERGMKDAGEYRYHFHKKQLDSYSRVTTDQTHVKSHADATKGQLCLAESATAVDPEVTAMAERVKTALQGLKILEQHEKTLKGHQSAFKVNKSSHSAPLNESVWLHTIIITL